MKDDRQSNPDFATTLTPCSVKVGVRFIMAIFTWPISRCADRFGSVSDTAPEKPCRIFCTKPSKCRWIVAVDDSDLARHYSVRAMTMPPSALMMTTTSGGARQAVNKTKPTTASPKSSGVLTELVQTGL
jgi:hypothetical protein